MYWIDGKYVEDTNQHDMDTIFVRTKHVQN